ncbi:MAG: hypothetical protein M5E90_01870 [Asgard group archaeon]|nr:hypothetical protein [Asgard group archaeon]
MISIRVSKWIKIIYSVIIRLLQLGWLGGLGLAIGILLLKRGFLFGIFPTILYLLNVIIILYIMIITPIFKIKTNLLFLFMFDFLSFLGNIAFHISSKITLPFFEFTPLAIPGIVFHLASLIPFILWSFIPMIKSSNNILNMKGKFYYGCVFLRNKKQQTIEDANNIDVTMFDDVVREEEQDVEHNRDKKNPFSDSEIEIGNIKPTISI